MSAESTGSGDVTGLHCRGSNRQARVTPPCVDSSSAVLSHKAARGTLNQPEGESVSMPVAAVSVVNAPLTSLVFPVSPLELTMTFPARIPVAIPAAV